MILGITPKNDYAFKRIFGSEQHLPVLIHLLNAVLRPPPEKRVVAVQILNPITEPVILDDKLAILDIKARDQGGCLFNVEMQLVLPPALRERFLYYWAKLYGSQLVSGDDYTELQPVISIYFVDRLLFPDTNLVYLPFSLYNKEVEITFSEHLQVHLFQLPNFTKEVENLNDPLDKWLYFFNNGDRLDPDQLPVPLQEPEYQEAARTLQVLTQDQLERERYEAREKALHDSATWEKGLKRMEQKAAAAEQKLAATEQKLAATEQKLATEQKARLEALDAQVNDLITSIRLFEQLLRRQPTPDEQLKVMSLEDLRRFTEQLRQEVLNQVKLPPQS